jgi:hypothetical protein
MPLWGTSADAATNKPKWCPDDADSDYDITKVFASQSGWVRRAGTAATGNDNTSAQEEVLVAIGGLAGASASTGLHHPTMTNFRVITKTDHGASNNIVFEMTFDEKIKYTAGSAATYVLDGASGSNRTATVTHIDGTAITTNLTGNVLRFTATSAAATTYTLNDDITLGNRTSLKDNVTSTSLEAAMTTLTSAIKTAIGVTTIVIA